MSATFAVELHRDRTTDAAGIWRGMVTARNGSHAHDLGVNDAGWAPEEIVHGSATPVPDGASLYAWITGRWTPDHEPDTGRGAR